MDLLESVEVPDGGVGALDPRDGVEREVGLAGEVVERQNVVVEHGEPEHGCRFRALVGRSSAVKRP